MDEGWVFESWDWGKIEFGGGICEFVKEIGENKEGKRVRGIIFEYKMERKVWWD